MESPYSRAPLNLRERQIRLVKLEHNHISEPIKCSLQSHTLDSDCPAYVALSYVWGTKQLHANLLLNELLFPIGRSLWYFLQTMRLQNQYIVFWIDAISIDQSNVLERNHQVQMMRQIYSNAHSVWVWLGESDHIVYSDIAMEYLERRKSFYGRSNNLKKLWSLQESKAVIALCERVYWKRIWIVQEIMLAENAMILCGRHQISWEKLQQLIVDLQTILDRGREVHTTGVLGVLNSPATVIVKAKSQWDGSLQPLTTLLDLYRNQQATDIRDKVYALHGLAYDSNAIVIDYRIDPKALLIKVIYHACLPQASKTDPKRTRKDVLRFAKMMKEALRVSCDDEELVFHISVARGDGVDVEKDYGLRMRGREESHHQSHPTLPDTGNSLSILALLDPTRQHNPNEYHSLVPLSHHGRDTAYLHLISNPVNNARRRRRIAIACDRCRRRKILCSGDPGTGFGCTNCRRAGLEGSTCQFHRVGSANISSETKSLVLLHCRG